MWQRRETESIHLECSNLKACYIFSYNLETREGLGSCPFWGLFFCPVPRLGELPLSRPKISIFVSKLKKVSIAYNSKTLTDAKVIHMKLENFLY